MLIWIGIMALMAAGQTESHACGNHPNATQLAGLIIAHPKQQRAHLQCHQLLSELAQQRAEAWINGSHDPEITPNQFVISGGYRFASFYPPAGNQIEAVASDHDSPDAALTDMINSNKHQALILGHGEFFERQHDLGVGFAVGQQGRNQYVILIAEAHSSPKIVIKPTHQQPTFTTTARCNKNWRHSRDPEVIKVCGQLQQENKD